MKHKSSWEMSKNETIFNKKERIEIYDEYANKHPNTKSKFKCAMCGKFHSWSELGKKH